MNWKVGLPAAVLMVTLMPTGAFCRNHHILDGLSPTAGLTNGTSALGGATSALGSHTGTLAGGLAGGLTNGLSAAASPVSNTFTNGLTNHSLFGGNSLFHNNSGILNNNNSILGRHRHKRNLLARILSALLPGRFINGRFSNNGSIFGNTSPGNGFRSMLGRNF